MFVCTRNPTQKALGHLFIWKRNYLKMSKMFPPFQYTVQKGGKTEGGTNKSTIQLMQKTNLIEVATAGTFHLLPLLTRSFEKLCRLIDQEMQGIGAQKLSMPCIAPAALWETTNRWDELGADLFRFTDRRGGQYCLAPTHEEAITSLVKRLHSELHSGSYRQLPIKLYQIGRKFRDEKRPKNGLLRCREFDMKDLYTFDENQESARRTYEEVTMAYRKIFDRLGVRYNQVEACTGAMGGDSSHEFHILSSLGEDTLCNCKQCGLVFNEELVSQDDFKCSHCTSPQFEKYSGIEIGHCFILGTKYSSALDATYIDRDHKEVPYYMGCYGIGVSRLLAAVLEGLNSDNIQWPRLIAPYQAVVLPMKTGYKSEESFAIAESISHKLSSQGNLRNEVILDDRVNKSVGMRVSAAKQVGIPYLVVAGRKSVEEGQLLEFIDVYNDKTEYFPESEVIERLSQLDTL